MNIDELFGVSAQQRTSMPTELWLNGTFDPHIHCRPKATGQMEMVVRRCIGVHEAIIDIANVPGITSIKAIEQRLNEIKSYIPPEKPMQVFVAPLANDHTDPGVIAGAYDRGLIKCIKIFWQGVSNDYGNSISSAAAAKPLIDAIAEHSVSGRKIVVTLHAECLKDYAGNVLPIKDREYWCVQNEVERMAKANPDVTYVIRHVSDYRTLEWIAEMRSLGFDIHGEIAPQYLMLTDDSIFTGDDGHAALQCNCVFWPRPKDKKSQTAIRRWTLAGLPWLHIGSDYALHLEDFSQMTGVKINARGVAAGGLNFDPAAAKSVLIDFFVSHGRADLIDPMMSGNAAKLYGVELSDMKQRYIRKNWTVPDYTLGEVIDPVMHKRVVRSANFLRGNTMHWQREDYSPV